MNIPVNRLVNEPIETDPFADLQYLSAFLDSTPDTAQREKIRLLAIGSPEGVTEVILVLHRLNFANVADWSPLLPVPESNAVMSILTRYRVRSLI